MSAASPRAHLPQVWLHSVWLRSVFTTHTAVTRADSGTV